MATIIAAETWPVELQREQSVSWTLDFGNEASPPALDGTSQYRSGLGGGLWRARFTAVALRTQAQVLAWQALEAVLAGGMTPIDVPNLLCQVPVHADGAATVITAVGAWATRAVSGRVDLEHAGVLKKGMHFSDYDATTYGWRMHRIKTVVSAGGTLRDITFWPPLRFAVADNHAFQFDDPRQVMRLSRPDAMDLELILRKRGDPGAEFIEAY